MKQVLGSGLIMAALVAFAPSNAAAGSGGGAVLVAAAVDIQAIVVRDDAGHVRRYSRGDVVNESDWRVASIRNDGAALEGVHHLAGARVEVRVRVGDRFRLRAPVMPSQSAAPTAHMQAMPANPGKQ